MGEAKVIKIRGFKEYFALRIVDKILRLSIPDYNQLEDPEKWFTLLEHKINGWSKENDLIPLSSNMPNAPGYK
jgi:hypothetical protein